ncbi:hypothetical protein NOVOSPHI9U_590008 [Novosphingobium sp. 9U]|nr:hypothetical protein NOVOSPHI9U_590008 [Novosphingobium sp. 9U]
MYFAVERVHGLDLIRAMTEAALESSIPAKSIFVEVPLIDKVHRRLADKAVALLGLTQLCLCVFSICDVGDNPGEVTLRTSAGPQNGRLGLYPTYRSVCSDDATLDVERFVFLEALTDAKLYPLLVVLQNGEFSPALIYRIVAEQFARLSVPAAQSADSVIVPGSDTGASESLG